MYNGAFIENESDKLFAQDGIEEATPIALDDLTAIDGTFFFCWNQDGEMLVCRTTASTTGIEYTMQREDLSTYLTTTQIFGSPRPPHR